MTSKRELLERVVKELNLDLNDPFTLIFAHAAALSDACAELRKELKAARELSSGPLQQQWIDIEERKPEPFEEVLVWHVLGDQGRCPHAIDIASLGKDGEWFFPWCGRLSKEECAPVWVKKWMPLPKTPDSCTATNEMQK